MQDVIDNRMTSTLIGDMPIDQFNRNIREQKPHKFDKVYTADEMTQLFELPELEELLNDPLLINHFDIYADGNLVHLNDMQHKSGKTALELAAQCFRQGQSLRMRELDRHNATIHNLVADAQRLFSARTQANLYLTPPGSAGFPPHFDITDVIVVQLLGEKHWKLYKNYNDMIDLPTPSTAWDPDRFKPSDNYESLSLRPGDVLYLPRGAMHNAYCEDRESMHLTISIVPVTYTDLLHDALNMAAEADVELRRRLPLSSITDDESLRAMAESLRERAINILTKMDLQALLQRSRNELNNPTEDPSKDKLEYAIADMLSSRK